MLKLIAALVISGQLAIAVETESGFVEKRFPNSKDGVESAIAFIEANLPSEGGIHVIVGWDADDQDTGPFVGKLAELGIANAIIPPEELKAFAQKAGVSGEAPATVALAFRAKLAALRRPK